MKHFKINFKLQAVPHVTKPVQMICSLNTKWEGKYLYQICQTGISVRNEDWDTNRNLPKKAELAGKLLLAKENAELALNRELSGYDDESIYKIYTSGYFKQELNEHIQKSIHKTVTQKVDYMNKNYRWQEIQREEAYEEILYKIKSAKYSLVDANGNRVNLDKFFSLDFGNDSQPELSVVPEAAQPVSVPDSRVLKTQAIESSAISAHDADDKYLNMTFVEFIKFVARRKKAMGELDNMSPYIVFANDFEEYDDTLTLGQISTDDFIDFFSWLLEQKDFTGSGTFNNYKKWAMAVLNFAERELSVVFNRKQLNLKSSIFQRYDEEVTRPYLTENMLSHLINVEFDKDNQHLEYPRDLFYISAYTGGLTFIDLHQGFNVQQKHVDGIATNYISVRRQKTGEIAEIPITDEVFSLLEKYKFQFIKISGKHYNDCIREACRIAGFTEDFVETRTNLKTKKNTTETKPFYSWIASHTARRSFCTNFHVHRGIDAKLVMSISQHKSYEAFEKYIQASRKIKFEEFVRQTNRKK